MEDDCVDGVRRSERRAPRTRKESHEYGRRRNQQIDVTA